MHNSVEPAGLLPTQEDFDAIMGSSLDYVEGWYNADAERMRRCLHPDLVKRTIIRDPGQGKWRLWRPTTAQMLVAYTGEGGGSDVPESERVYQITILDVFRHIASVKCISPWYVDYLQLAKFDGQRWLIVNALWEMRQGEYQPEP
jgi:hypothetical protein